jgi:uncharacterized membrane protein YfcA
MEELANIVGGFGGTYIAKRIPDALVRGFVLWVGIVVAIYLYLYVFGALQ